jgi:hypothetical protein
MDRGAKLVPSDWQAVSTAVPVPVPALKCGSAWLPLGSQQFQLPCPRNGLGAPLHIHIVEVRVRSLRGLRRSAMARTVPGGCAAAASGGGATCHLCRLLCATSPDAARRRRPERTPAVSGVLDLHPNEDARARTP